jgi:hypothetical protein
MADQEWTLKGIYYEVCRSNGHCPLNFGRDMVGGPCVNLATYQVTEGQIKGVDMKGALFMIHADGIGPRFVDLFPGQKGIAEIAVYIDENATDEQKKALEEFLSTHLQGALARKILGFKSVKIDIEKEGNNYVISNPYFKQTMIMAIGGDGENPIVIANPISRYLKDIKVYNGEWTYTDYGKKLEFHQASALVADFSFRGRR